MEDFIRVRGAKEHNLKNVNVDIPRNNLVVITGISGSGKSSLAFDTIYAEGQRRYVESLSAYARQFLEMQDKPEVESIEGLSPAIAIEQKTTSKNPRSTVSTVTEVYDYLRLLYARIGVPHSPATGQPIESQSASQMVEEIMKLPEETKVYLLAPIVRDRKGEHTREILNFKKQGYTRVKIDGQLYKMDEIPELNKNKKHDIEIVIDRLVIKDDLGNRLADSVETAIKISDGILLLEIVGLPDDAKSNHKRGDIITFSEKFSCPVSGFTLTEVEPRLFSFNSPQGACPKCDGLGDEIYFDPSLVVPDPNLTLDEGVIAPWASSGSNNPSNKYSNSYLKFCRQILEGLARHYNFSLNKPFNKLKKEIQDIILYGSGEEEIKLTYQEGFKSHSTTKPFEGVIPNLERRWRDTESNSTRDELSRYQSVTKCSACGGYRLREEALCVKVADTHIGEVCTKTIGQAVEWFDTLDEKLTPTQQKIAERILKELVRRLSFLKNVGLDYLTLNRKSGTLSGGESQRIRLASQIGSGLSGVLYVLDEPSIGLHQCDNNRLLDTLKHLRDLGNTVLVVEHDEDTMRYADHLIDVGPGAGIHGGLIISQGTPEEVQNDPNSITGQYLKGSKFIPVPEQWRSGHENKEIKVVGASANNLQNINAAFPLGTFTCVTGVSGGGKSSLVIETIYKAAAKKLNGKNVTPGKHDSITGLEYVDKIIEIDQSPIGRTPRSNPATYTGAFSPIRDWFASLPEAKARGYKAGRFSFNVKGGRCESCEGDGVLKIEMHFLPDVYVTCEECQGKRYNKETLEIQYKGKSIADILSMTVEEAKAFFEKIPLIHEKLKALQEVGLGYIKIGQSAPTLSGGEAQRVKLAKELSKRSTGRTLYILDEPTTGLHTDDIGKLLKVLHHLVDLGNTVLVIEHNLDVIKTSDHIIDIGPGGGDKGGNVVATGTPLEVAENPDSITGEYLKSYLVDKFTKKAA